MIVKEKRNVVEEQNVNVEYICDVCGRREAVDELPPHWCEIYPPWDEDADDIQVCQPGCFFKKMSQLIGQGDFSMEMSETFILSLVEFAKPFFAEGELD